MTYKFNFKTDYHQFYLYDKDSPGRTDSDNFWNDDANKSKLAIEDGIIGITVDNDNNIVDGEIKVLHVANLNPELEKYNRIVEASLHIKSGKLQIVDCPNFSVELEINIEPAEYRMRIFTTNLDYEIGEGKDYFTIEVWKATFDNRIVLKSE